VTLKPAGRRPEAMQQPTDDADEVQLEVAYFELVDAGPPLTLLRLGGHWAGVDPADLPAPTLVLEVDGDEHRLQPLPEAHSAGPAEDEPSWRAAFAAPAGLAAAQSTSYALDVGRVVTLPHPFERHLADEHAAPEEEPTPAAPVGPEPAAPDEEPAPAAAAPAGPEPTGPDEEPAAAAASAEPAGAARPQPTRRRVDPRLVAALVAGLLLVLVVIAAATSGGGGGESDGGQTATAPGGGGAKQVTLTPVPVAGQASGEAAGRITRDGRGRLVLHVSGLEGRRSGVWLFDSIIDSRPIGTIDGAEGQVVLPPPDQLRRFRYIDVSREDDDNPNHSGRSVLRVKTASVR
jgi:hypothetical protein